MSSYLDQAGTQYLWGKVKTWVGNQGYLKTHQTVTDASPALSWGATSKVATIGNTDIHVTMPSNPNTHQKAYKTMHLENYYGAAAQEDISATQAEDTFSIKSGTDIQLTWASGTKTLTISAPAVSGKVSKSGDTMTGLLTSNTAHGSSWNKARDNGFIRSLGFNNNGSYYPAVVWRHQGGDWSIGSLGNSKRLYFSHVRDTEYSGNNYSDVYYLDPPADGNAHSYAIYHTGYKPTYSDVGAAASGHNHDSTYLKKSSSYFKQFLQYDSWGAVGIATGSSSWKKVVGFTITTAGWYLCHISVTFPTNSNGKLRQICLSAKGSTTSSLGYAFYDNRPAMQLGETKCHITCWAYFEANGTYNILAAHDAGSTLNVTPRMYAARFT